MKVVSLWSLVVSLLLGCTMIPDATTRVYVHERMRSVQMGNSFAQVKYILDGEPHLVSRMQQGGDSYELWEYRIGNFLYAETAMILFRNGLVVALPRSGQALVEALQRGGVVQQADFWK